MRDIEILDINESLKNISEKVIKNTYIVDYVTYASVSKKNLETAIFTGQFFGFFVDVELKNDGFYLLTYSYHRR